MKLVIPPITVNKGMGFEKDLFGRQGFGEALNNILKQCKDPLVISIDGNWGEGKSTFVRMWQDLLDKDNIPNIYIDAFANDHTDDPFMVVASAVHDYAEEYVSKDLAEKFAEKAKKAGAKILPWAGKMLIKTLSLGIVKSSDIDEAKEIIEEITDDFGESAEKMIHEKLQNHKHDVATINSFKHFLSEMPKMIGDKNAPLTIIIDELDRCRPSFAVETLEKIKHLFSVPNIAFVLVINKPQLE
jgi:predicted KAP-like P-loop ATPase